MIRAFLLIFDPTRTWDKIEAEKRGFVSVFLLFILPLILLTTVVEAWGFMNLGKARGTLIERVAKVSQPLTFRYESFQLLVTGVTFFCGAYVLKVVGSSFHRRHTYNECFITLAYSLSPMLLCRILNLWPPLSPWVAWAIGIVLGVAHLYRGIPRVMKPDPSNALGLYTICTLLLVVITGIGQYFLMLVLDEKWLTHGWWI